MSASPQDSTHAGTVFSAGDPVQACLRACLDTMTEDELIAIETDLQLHARTGMMTRRVRSILANISANKAQLAA